MRLRVFIFLISTIISLSLSNITHACSIAASVIDVEDVVADSDVVFAGIVENTKASEKLNIRGGTFSSKVKVFKLYKGWIPGDEVTVQGVSDDCVHNVRAFTGGKLLILFANYRSDGDIDIPAHFSEVRQSSLVSYLENGEGRHNITKCLRAALENVHERPNAGHECFKKDTSKDDPFRFIPPEQ